MSTISTSAATGMAVLLVGVFGGCAADSEPGPRGSDSAQATPVDLLDRELVSTRVTVHGHAHPLVDQTAVALTFTERGVQASAGCNQQRGTATWDGTVVTVGELGGTEMLCTSALMEQDRWLVGVLSNQPTVEGDGDVFTMSTDRVVIELVDRGAATPDRSLTGTLWVLDTIGAGMGPDRAKNSVFVRSTLTITGSNMSTELGCNIGGGTVERTGSTLTFGPILATQMLCEGPRGDVEQAVVGVLDGEVDFRIDGATLTLANGDDSLVYRADPPPGG